MDLVLIFQPNVTLVPADTAIVQMNDYEGIILVHKIFYEKLLIFSGHKVPWWGRNPYFYNILLVEGNHLSIDNNYFLIKFNPINFVQAAIIIDTETSDNLHRNVYGGLIAHPSSSKDSMHLGGWFHTNKLLITCCLWSQSCFHC